MNKHGKKMVAPVIITVLLLLYFIGFAVVVFLLRPPLAACIIGAVIPLALAGVALGVCIQRIREIRSGEEDDLSKY
ncbi:hypothetical protein DWX43_12970 [Clostridium sp. AF19-22AC]|jgi:uncharacterized membrane protein (DUF485 family)|uniref:Uncharacterized protein n=1 Tax=Faecalicatena orotica TaxID=1544 RepID=A0A2Y9BLP1_9FIRM|nr:MULTISPECIES: hypothetical protein [Clostridia]PWJ21480.1 hypothetical protein A8806_12049 [Faecalicatena orotica]RHR28108.1 hypothetical protein DWX43_12970 [Clostridium sp. AF19-22AC]SSA58455.1 hypothetical protein SAMN05216536_12049 [Faecalicatena orotica]